MPAVKVCGHLTRSRAPHTDALRTLCRRHWPSFRSLNIGADRRVEVLSWLLMSADWPIPRFFFRSEIRSVRFVGLRLQTYILPFLFVGAPSDSYDSCVLEGWLAP